MTVTILTLTGAFALVAAMLAYLIILSRLHWVLKALATLATAALVPFTLNGISELRGLPSDGPLPESFQMLWAQVIEPNPLMGEKGGVFLWLQTLDDENYPLGVPRAYELPYAKDLVMKVNDAMVKISQGEEMQGEVKDKPPEQQPTAEELAAEVKAGAQDGAVNSGGVGDRVYQFDPSMLSFGVKAAPITPEKGQ